MFIRNVPSLRHFKLKSIIHKNTSSQWKKSSHQNPPTYLFTTVLTCKWCLICVYFSPDSDKMTVLLEKAIFIDKSILAGSDRLKLKTINDEFITNTHLFTESCGLLVDYCNVFIICLDSHSDGTHSLQRIHCWASDVMLHFTQSVLMKKQTHLHLVWSEQSKY